MTTVAKADKSRLTIRGLVDGDQYIVREQPGGWNGLIPLRLLFLFLSKAARGARA